MKYYIVSQAQSNREGHPNGLWFPRLGPFENLKDARGAITSHDFTNMYRPETQVRVRVWEEEELREYGQWREDAWFTQMNCLAPLPIG